MLKACLGEGTNQVKTLQLYLAGQSYDNILVPVHRWWCSQLTWLLQK